MKDPLQFILAGKAIFTVKSKVTGKHFTFKAIASKLDMMKGCYSIFVLTGPDNASNYTYMGMVDTRRNGNLIRTRKSKVGPDSPSFKAFRWVYGRLLQDLPLTDCTIQHEGKCGKCGRKLTHPDSLESGIGPECAKRV